MNAAVKMLEVVTEMVPEFDPLMVRLPLDVAFPEGRGLGLGVGLA